MTVCSLDRMFLDRIFKKYVGLLQQMRRRTKKTQYINHYNTKGDIYSKDRN